MKKYNSSQPMPLTRIERRRVRAATVGIDLVVITGMGAILIGGITYAWTHHLVAFGTALCATTIWFIYRVIVFDNHRLQDASVKEYVEQLPEVRLKPYTINQTSTGSVVYRYGQLDGTQNHYTQLLNNIQNHPYQRLTRRALPDGMLKDPTVNYPRFRDEMIRLEWIDDSQVITQAGIGALKMLSDGDEVPLPY